MRLYAVLISLLFVPYFASAGSVNCTGVTNVTTATSYVADASDCIISVVNTGVDSVVVTLPASGEFTVRDNSDYTNDTCYDDGLDPIFCWPGGLTIQSADAPSVTVDGSTSTTLSGYYYQTDPSRQSVQLIYNTGTSNWDANYGYWR